MADDSILITFSADVASYEKAIDQAEVKTLGLQKVADDTSKRFSNIGKGNTFAPLQKGLKDTAQEAGKANRELKKTTDELQKGAKGSANAFIQMRNELKNLRGQLTILASQGKENTKEFKALQIQAGALQDQMKDLGTSIQLNAGDPLENLSTSFGSVRNSISSLDFDGVSRGLGSLATNVSRIDLKTFKDGLGAVANNVVKLGAALLSSPIFLVGAAVAGIIAGIVTWGDSMEDIAARNDKAVDKILRSLEATTAEYDRQIKLNEAAGKSTAREEDRKLRAIIRTSKEAIAIKDREIALFNAANKKLGAFNEIVNLEDKERFKKLTEDKFQLEQQLFDARADLRVKDLEAQTKADEEAAEKAKADADKAKAEAIRRAQELIQVRRDLQQSQINLLEEGQRKERQQIRFDFEQRLNAIKGQSAEEIALRASLIKERDAKLAKVEEESKQKKIGLIRTEGKDSAREIKQLNSNDLELLKSGAKNLDEFRRIQAAARAEQIRKDVETYAAFGNSIVTIGQSVTTLLSENQEEAAERNKLFAAFGIGLNLASSLAQMIAGATAAAATTGPLAPFTLISYIAAGTAQVLGAFAQIKTLLSAPPPKGAAKGEEFVKGKAKGVDTEHYMLAHGERVVTSAVNEKYYDVLHAMHTGNERAILPALRKALGYKAEREQDGFASSIANSLMLNRDNWKGSNIVDKLAFIDKKEDKRNHELVNALRTRSTHRKK